MDLVVGGAWQGKTNAACIYFGIEKEELLDGRTCEFQEIYSGRGIYHFHEFIKRMLKEELPIEKLAEELAQRNPDVLIISDEIGYGLVPMDAFERKWREQTGRVCCELAQKSEMVIRVTAGVPNIIKGNK